MRSELKSAFGALAASALWACGLPAERAGALETVALERELTVSEDRLSGCWVNAFGREDFRPPLTTYTGPSHERLFMKGAASVAVGPTARLVGYAGSDYERPSLVLGPGARIPELALTDFHRRVDSFHVECTSP